MKFHFADKVNTEYGPGRIVELDNSEHPYCVNFGSGPMVWFGENELSFIVQNPNQRADHDEPSIEKDI